MKPITPFDSFPSFGNGGSRSAPGDAKYALGFVPADTFPAEWANYFFHGATKGVSDLNSAVTSLWNEMGSVLSNYNITPNATDNDQLLECLTKLKAEAALAAHPVGSLYWTSVNENPATTFGGGTWVQIKDRFILAAGDTYSNGVVGGEATVTLTRAEMPAHGHLFVPEGIVSRTSDSTVNVTGTTEPDGAHSHSVKVAADYVAGTAYDFGFSATGWGSNHDTIYAGTAETAGSHSHYCSFTGTASGGGWTFTGQQKATGNDGDGQAHNNMPPYIVKYCWQRTA